MNLLKWKPYIFATIYFGNIILFTFIYYVFFDEDFNQFTEIGWVESLYFSIVSITTLGYGDITPKLESKILLITIIIQVSFGIITIGLFLNALSQKLSDIKDSNLQEKIDKEQKIILSKQLRILKPIIEEHLTTLSNIYAATAAVSGKNEDKFPSELFSTEYYDRISIVNYYEKKYTEIDGISVDRMWCDYIDSEFDIFKDKIETFLLKFSVTLPMDVIELLTELETNHFLKFFKDERSHYNRYSSSGLSSPPLLLSLEHSESGVPLPDNEKQIKIHHQTILKLINIVDEATKDKIKVFIRDDKERSIYFGKAIGKLTTPKQDIVKDE